MFDGIFQPTHLIIILIICLFVFGPTKLPQLGKGMAEGIREFKKAINDPGTSPSASQTTTSTEEKK